MPAEHLQVPRKNGHVVDSLQDELRRIGAERPEPVFAPLRRTSRTSVLPVAASTRPTNSSLTGPAKIARSGEKIIAPGPSETGKGGPSSRSQLSSVVGLQKAIGCLA